MDITVPNFSGRLRAAREAAGYPTGAAAIKAIGIDVNTYYQAAARRIDAGRKGRRIK
jgi:hypothetical protein